MDLFDLAGTTAVVTGGNSGIGLAAATALCEAGARVSIWGSNGVKTKDTAEELGALGYDVLPLTVDVAEEADVNAAFDSVATDLGAIGVVVACAGVAGAYQRFTELDTPEWHRVMGVNADGVFYTLRAGARQMLQAEAGGSLIAVSSMMAKLGQARTQPYAASKASIGGLVRSAAAELGPHGIRVNAVLPGYVETPLASEALNHAPFADAALPRTPLGRWGRPADIAGIIVYLASSASRWHTGTEIVVDGGYSISG